MDDLLPDFIAETRETLQVVAGSLVAWEASPDDRALLDEIFRFVHTVKGSCGFLNLPRLQRLSHAAEDALASVRSGVRSPDPKFVTATLRVIDRIAELTEALGAGESVPDLDEDRLIAEVSSPTSITADLAPVADALPRVRAPGSRAASRTVRLPLDLLDQMMSSVSEIVLARNQLARELPNNTQAEIGSFERLSACVGDLRDAVTRARMSRIDALFGALPRLVRDLALGLGKQVVLSIDGGEVELDREMIELVRDPLLHAVRNAVDHGLESPEARVALGKPPEGRITVSARQSGSRIIVEIADDGRGIDKGRLVARAMEARLITAHDAAELDQAGALDLVFRPGLSTAPQVTAISGRGVGMDVVRANVERLGGTVVLESSPGIGTRLILEVPLTLAIISAIMVGCGQHRFGIAQAAIDEIVRVHDEIRIERVGSGLMADVRAHRMPIADLRMLIQSDAQAALPELLVILRTAGGGRYALGVDTVHDHEELVVKPAAPLVMATGLFAGTTLPDDNRPMLLLDIGGLAAAAGITPMVVPVPTPAAVAPLTLPTLLVRDLDGAERAIRLSAVDRIDEVESARVLKLGGRYLLVDGERLVPLHACGELPERVRVLRIGGARSDLAYAVREVIDVSPVTVDLLTTVDANSVAGVLMHDGRPIELIDVEWLLGTTEAPALVAEQDGEQAKASSPIIPSMAA